jgi:hypothetical protein
MITREESTGATPDSADADTSESTPTTPMEVFNAALEQAGIDAGSLHAVERNFTVSSPAGSYQEHDIYVDYGYRQVAYTVDLMMEKPSLTALEVSKTLAEGTKQG